MTHHRVVRKVATVAVLLPLALSAAAIRLTPTTLSATYTRVAGAPGAKCPLSLDLGPAASIGDVPPVSAALIPAAAIAENDAAPCTGGGLLAVESGALFSTPLQDAVGVTGGILQLFPTLLALQQLFWSDVVGLNMSSWACAGDCHAWPPNVHAMFGNRPAVFASEGNGTVRLASGDRNLIAINGTHITCLMRAPPASAPPLVNATLAPQRLRYSSVNGDA
ncbi:hypothetical protein MMPV_009805 [Pyropia vietnamensis]